ncbi:MAG: response regulator [Aromatoleum sp.]|nr:response regulator [Aromatoleum sp.]
MEPCSCSRVFIVEDSASIRSRLVDLLGEIDGVCVVGEAETPGDAITGIQQTQPHCVVLDYQLIGGTGVDVLRAVRPASPEIAFVVLTNHPNAQYRRICMEAGADWFLDKSTEFGKIKEVVAKCILTRN